MQLVLSMLPLQMVFLSMPLALAQRLPHQRLPHQQRALAHDPLEAVFGPWQPPNRRMPMFRTMPFDEAGLRHLRDFQPRPSDTYILTAPRTGTTFLQMLLHALRTGGTHTAFDDVYQIVPWDKLAWDIGQRLDAEQVAFPRLFKSHSRLGVVNRGARYVTLVRDVEATASSVFNFFRAKGANSELIGEHTTASEWVVASRWSNWADFYADVARGCALPNVLALCYEDVAADPGHFLDLLADFISVPRPVDAARKRILRLSSRGWMKAHGSRFDESFWSADLVGPPASRVNRKGLHGELDAAAKRTLKELWSAEVATKTGLSDYGALRQLVRAELDKKEKAAAPAMPFDI